MPTVSLIAINNGDAADATPVQANFAELQAACNALDTANWATGKIFAPSKITQEGAATDQAMVWNGTTWIGASYKPSKLAQEAATTGQVLAWSGAIYAPTTVAQLLGSVTYDPTTVTSATTSSTTGADIDATNLSLTVTLPGTKMLVIFDYCPDSPGSDMNKLFLGIRESTNNIAYRKVIGSVFSTGGIRLPLHVLVTGLTAGAHTYKAAFKSQAASACGVIYGTAASPLTTNPGPFTMSIWSVL